MVFPSGSITIGDYYGMAVNGQGVVIKNENLSEANGKGISPIAVIFSTATSTSDMASSVHDAWTHGYAMSLARAGLCIWGEANTTLPKWNLFSEWKDNFDGYTETWTIGENASYPAFYNAIRYKYTVVAPLSSSNWYLPSNGQCYLILKNLAEIDYTQSDRFFTKTSSYPETFTTEYNTGTCIGIRFGDVYSQFVSKVDGYITSASSYAATSLINSGGFIATSSISPYSNLPFYLEVSGNSYFVYHYNIPVTHDFQVRPVLAF